MMNALMDSQNAVVVRIGFVIATADHGGSHTIGYTLNPHTQLCGF